MTALDRRAALGLLGALGASGWVGRATDARAQAAPWPNRPLQIVIAFPPGGTSTNANRPVVEKLAGILGQPVELEYKPGAGGNVAAQFVRQGPADGHMLFYGHAGPLAINHHINLRTFFDPARDFRPVTLAVGFPIVIAVPPALGVRTVPELVARARGGQTLHFGSSGNGSVQHLAGELFQRAAGIELLHVPFAGGGPLQKAFLDGDIQVLFETGSNVAAHIREGRMTPLAVLSAERMGAFLPDVPTLAQAGIAGLEAEAWFGYLVTAGTPEDIVRRLDAALRTALADPDVRRALGQIGARVIADGPEAFARHIAAEDARWGRLVRDAKIRPD
jgi:tripartite-type tricarboxylate transporter receptor subunit TctC